MGGENRVTECCPEVWVRCCMLLTPSAQASLQPEQADTGMRLQQTAEGRDRKWHQGKPSPQAPRGSVPTTSLKVGAVTPLSQGRRLADRGDGPSQKGTQWASREALGIVVHARTQSCLAPGGPVSCSPPGSSVHGISRARIREWVATSSSRGSFRPGIELHLLHWQAGSLSLSPQGSPGHLHQHCPKADLGKGSAIIYLAAPGKNLGGILPEILWFLPPPPQSIQQGSSDQSPHLVPQVPCALAPPSLRRLSLDHSQLLTHPFPDPLGEHLCSPLSEMPF